MRCLEFGVANQVSRSTSRSACLKYTKRHAGDGTRLLLVCDVALGKCKDVRKRDLTLTRAPDGYHCVHGVRSTPNAESDFEVSDREEGLRRKRRRHPTVIVPLLTR